MAKKKAKKQKAWALVDRKTGVIAGEHGWSDVFRSRNEARSMRRMFLNPETVTVSRVTITIED